MEYFAYILIFSNLLIFKIFWDCRALHIEKRQINKKRSAIIDGVIYAMGSIALFDNWHDIVGAFVAAVAARGLLFDLAFNWVNGWKWYFCGTTSKIDEVLDNLDGKNDSKCILGIVLKILVLGIGITIILI